MSGLPPDYSAHIGGFSQTNPPYIQCVRGSGYTVPVSNPIAETAMTTIDERVSKLETSGAVQAQEMKGLATKADLERIFSELRETLHKELDPIRTDIASIKTEITHHPTKAWVYATLAAASISALGAIGSIFTIINVAPKH